MRLISNELTLLSGDALPSATFTMDTTNKITATGHGLSVGNILRFTTVTTLPDGLSLATDYYVVEVVDVNTIKVSTSIDGPAITSLDAGTGAHTYTLTGNVFKVYDYRHIDLMAFSSGNFNGTVKIQISNQEDVNFNNAASKTNRWSYVQLKDLIDASTVNGSVGVTSAGTDISKTYEININSVKYLSANYSAYTTGKLSLIAVGFSN